MFVLKGVSNHGFLHVSNCDVALSVCSVLSLSQHFHVHALPFLPSIFPGASLVFVILYSSLVYLRKVSSL